LYKVVLQHVGAQQQRLYTSTQSSKAMEENTALKDRKKQQRVICFGRLQDCENNALDLQSSALLLLTNL